MIDVSVARAGNFQSATVGARRFAQWWLSSLRHTVPKAWLVWAEGEGRPSVMISRQGKDVVCRIVPCVRPAERRFPARSFNTKHLVSWLAEYGLSREHVLVLPVLADDLFFLREMVVPKPALPSLSRILDQELLRRTPFQLADVWHEGHVSSDGERDPATVTHWIIRRDHTTLALDEIGLQVDDVDGLAPSRMLSQETAVPVIAFHAREDEDPVWAVRIARLLAGAGIAVTIIALLLFDWSQAAVATALEDELSDARQAAQIDRDGIDPAARLIAIKGETSVLKTLDELSRVLPDHTFLTDARVADGVVTVSGFSADAARLVRTIDTSSLFYDAALTAPITPDVTEHKERFTIAFKVRGVRLLPQSRSEPSK